MPTIDYAVSNLVRYVRLLITLRRWDIDWEDIAQALDVSDPELAIWDMEDIELQVFKIMASALDLSQEDAGIYGRVVEALGLPCGTPVQKVIDAFCSKKDGERFNRGEGFSKLEPGKELFEQKRRDGATKASCLQGHWIDGKRVGISWVFFYESGKIVVWGYLKRKNPHGPALREGPCEQEFSNRQEFNNYIQANNLFFDDDSGDEISAFTE